MNLYRPTIAAARELEPLVGTNRGMVRQRLANIHCMTPILRAARAARPDGGLRKYPVGLRRGWALCVLATLAEYRILYADVVTGNI